MIPNAPLPPGRALPVRRKSARARRDHERRSYSRGRRRPGGMDRGARSGEWARAAIRGIVRPVAQNPRVNVHRNTTVAAFEGEPGRFRARLSNGQEIEPAAAILCTGFTHFDSVNKPEWGFGTYSDVVTTTQVEQMLSSG